MTGSALSERENEIIGLVAQAFPEMQLDARRVSVHKLEGGEATTLRFTLDDAYSADLETRRIESSSEPTEELAREVEGILRQQL